MSGSSEVLIDSAALPTPVLAEESWDYEAFISYSHRDAKWARWLHKSIETYKLPSRLQTERGLKARLGKLFLDRSELPSSASLADTIQSALRRSRCLVVICSPASAASRWVNEEIRLFRSLGRGDRIFCLIVDGVPNTDNPATCAFPPALLAPDREGGEALAEPLAADVRPNQDGRADAKLKIVAGLLEVSFDDLRQREAVRRQRRLIVIIAVGAVLMLTMLGLTIAAVLARQQAERQTLTAVRTTDFLRSLFQVSDPNEARGAQVTAREMLDRGAASLTSSSELRDQPAVRADLLTTLAEVYSSLGLYNSADRLAGVAGKIDGQEDAARARQAKIVAQIALQNSDYARGDKALAEALRLAGSKPSRLRMQLLLERGELFKAMGRAPEAEAVLTQARDAALAADPPDQDAATHALATLAANDFESGNYDRAVVRLGDVVKQRTALNGPLHTEVSYALNTLGTVAIKRGDRVAAARYFTETLDRQRKVLGPGHADVAITEGNLARAYVEGRRFAEAAALVEHARASILRNNDGTLDSLANLYDTLGLAQHGLGRMAAAEDSFSNGLRIARLHQMPKEGEIFVDLAELQCATGRTTEGRAGLDRAVAVYAATGANEDWRQARLSSVRGGCLLAAGKAAAARPLVEASFDAIKQRWGADSLFGLAAARLRREVSAASR